MRILDALVPYLVGAAATLAVQMIIQFYAVPRVEARKRREERWERDVLDFGELLTTQVGELSSQARIAQMTNRVAEALDPADWDEDELERERRKYDQGARDASSTFLDLIRTRVEWMVERIESIAGTTPPKIIDDFSMAALRYRMTTVTLSYWHEPKPESDEDFQAAWDKERTDRQALIGEVKKLALLPHPPRK